MASIDEIPATSAPGISYFISPLPEKIHPLKVEDITRAADRALAAVQAQAVPDRFAMQGVSAYIDTYQEFV